MLPTWETAIITRIIDETATTKRFFFEVPGRDVFDFIPGQFVTFDLPIAEQKNKRWRSYSIASWPNGTNGFELVIVKLEGGLGTSWLWSNATVGLELSFRGALGKFVLPEEIDTDLFFICTGTGIAPFRSMLHHIHLQGIPHQHLYLIFGCRQFGDCLYGPEMKGLQQQLTGFEYYPTFSREPVDNHLLLRTGYVHQVYEEIVLRNRKLHEIQGGEGLKPAKFFLCGWKNMIDDARLRIEQLGYDRKSVHYELYG